MPIQAQQSPGAGHRVLQFICLGKTGDSNALYSNKVEGFSDHRLQKSF